MKKKLALFLATVSMMSLAACGSKADAPVQTPSPETNAPVEVEEKTWTPEHEVVVICPYSAGGSSDMLTRVFTTTGADAFDVPMVVNNMGGANCSIGFSAAIQSKADGYTITHASIAAVTNGVKEDAPYVYYEELQPICKVAENASVFYVRADSDIKNLDDLRDALLSREVIASVTNLGGSSHYTVEWFAKTEGSDITSVRYDNGAEAIAAVLGGHAEITSQTPADGMEYVRSGDLRAIAVLNTERSKNEVFKDVPTSVEQGYEYLVNTSYQGFAMPKGAPEEVLEYYENAFKRAVEMPEVKEAIEGYGFEVKFEDHDEYYQTWLKSAETAKYINSELADRLQ